MRKTVAILALCLAVAACNGGEAEEATTTSAAGAGSTTTTTDSPDTTTTAESTPETTSTIPTTTTTSDPFAPQGAGCTPGEGGLPDGEWYGGVREFDANGIGFDLACLFWGDAATAAAAEDGEESPPPNDYYVRNENDLVRQLPVASDTPVTWYTSGDPNDEVTGSYPEWIEFLSTQESYLGIFVTIESGDVTEIREWWTP